MAQQQVKSRFQQKQDTAANWEQNDQVLYDGELALAKTASGVVRMKSGDGTKRFSQLPYLDEAIYGSIAQLTTSFGNHTHTEKADQANGKVVPEQIAASLGMVTSSRAFALTDCNTCLLANSAGVLVLTIPANAAAAFPIGSEIEVMRYGAGAVSIAPAAGVTLVSPDNARAIATRYGAASLKKIGTDEWWLEGRLG